MTAHIFFSCVGHLRPVSLNFLLSSATGPPSCIKTPLITKSEASVWISKSLSKLGNFNTCAFTHYNKKGPYCDPNILANNKEIRFRKSAVLNKNSSQTFKPLRNPHLRTCTIASSLQLPKLNPSQHISAYKVFYTRFAIHNTSKIIENKPNIAMT
jgi:hypothetical protein